MKQQILNIRVEFHEYQYGESNNETDEILADLLNDLPLAWQEKNVPIM